MKENLIIVLGLANPFLCSVLFHWLLKSFWRATVLSALVASIIWQLLSYWELGYMEPFFEITIFTGTAAAFIIALIVGILFKEYRKRHSEQNPTMSL